MRGATSPLNVRSSERGTNAFGERGHLLLELTAVRGEELQDEMLDAAGGQLVDLIDERSGLAREHAPGMGGRRDRLTRLENAHVVASRERGRRGAAARPGTGGGDDARRGCPRRPRSAGAASAQASARRGVR